MKHFLSLRSSCRRKKAHNILCGTVIAFTVEKVKHNLLCEQWFTTVLLQLWCQVQETDIKLSVSHVSEENIWTKEGWSDRRMEKAA
jgi:hypothetical protein